MGWEDDWYMFWYDEVYEGNEYIPPDRDDNNDTGKSDRKISDYKYYCRQARTCSIKGDHSTAIKFYNEALRYTVSDYKKWDVFCAIAGEYEETGDYELAESYWNRCREIERTPGHIAKRADFSYRRGRWEEAIAIYEKALEALKALKDKEIDLNNLKICARIAHYSIDSYYMLGGDIHKEEYHNELKHEIYRFILTDRHLGDEVNAYYLSKTGWELYEDDALAGEALILIDSAIKLNPNPPANDYNRKAIMLEKTHQFEEALKYYDRALSINGSEETFLNNKAGCIRNELKTKLILNRIRPDDLDLINEALKILPRGCDNSEYLFTKSQILNQLGDPVKARICSALSVKNYDEVDKAEKQLKKLKSSETYINITGVHFYKHFAPFAEGTVVDLCKEPGNPHDRYAIRVEIDGETVGYVANSRYTLIKEVKSARDLKNVKLNQAEVQFILFDEWVIAKLIRVRR